MDLYLMVLFIFGSIGAIGLTLTVISAIAESIFNFFVKKKNEKEKIKNEIPVVSVKTASIGERKAA